MSVRTCECVVYLLVGLSQAQHDGGLGEHSGFDLLGVLEDAQRLVEVRSGVTHTPGNPER